MKRPLAGAAHVNEPIAMCNGHRMRVLQRPPGLRQIEADSVRHLHVLVNEIDTLSQPGQATQIDGRAGLGRIELDQCEQVATQRRRGAKDAQPAEIGA